MHLKTLTVSELNLYVKRLISSDIILNHVSVCGEISNFQISSSIAYFTLKDTKDAISCIIYSENLDEMGFVPQDGMNVIISAKATLYERDGRISLNVYKIELSGEGELYIAYQKLKNKLLKEGLFDPQYKKPVPAFPQKICVVTSLSGSVVHDIITITKRRNPGQVLTIYPVKVQGIGAAAEIIDAIGYANKKEDIDLIIIARGGGSMEDLWTFNDERLAYAIFNSKIPVISAVGHETDYTIADFVSDKRAPTPSAAAEISVPNVADYKKEVAKLTERLHFEINYIFSSNKAKYDNLYLRLMHLTPKDIVKAKENELKYLNERLITRMKDLLISKQNQLKSLDIKLKTLSPYSILDRGYAIVKKDKSIAYANLLNQGDLLDIIFKDGKVKCITKEVDVYGEKHKL